MAILNSRFAFLEADFENPNLNNVKYNLEHNTAKYVENNQFNSEERKAPNNLTTFQLKSFPIFEYVNAMPADLYSAALFLLVKNF